MDMPTIEMVERRRRAQVMSLAVTNELEAQQVVDFTNLSTAFTYEGEAEGEPGVFLFAWRESVTDPPWHLRSDSGYYVVKHEVEANLFSSTASLATSAELYRSWEPA